MSLTTSGLASGRLSTRRRVTNAVALGLLGLAVAVAIIPLVGVITYTVAKGAGVLSARFFTESMRGVGPFDTNGGVYHAIIGTLEQVGIAAMLSIPLGIAVAIYLVEYENGPLATVVRVLVDVMTGIPSIVAGLFIFAFWVLAMGQGFSGLAAGLALAVLMLPVVVRASEEMLRLVPAELREGAYALGVPKWRTIVSVVLPTASAGITTGVMLAIARVAGETAPLLLTAFGNDSVNVNPLHGAQSGLPLFVFNQAGSPLPVANQRAWGAALTLIAVVVLLTVVARLLTRRNQLAG
jgi:phosphate transport system permease protein